MALLHNFILINGNVKVKQVDVPDDLICYIKDSLAWIVSLWNEKSLNEGLPYYGTARIEGEQIAKFKELVVCWRTLFSLAPDEIVLTGLYIIDEGKYEKIRFDRTELLDVLDRLINLCTEGEQRSYSIFYMGI